MEIMPTPWKSMEEACDKKIDGIFLIQDAEDIFKYGFGSGALLGGLDKKVTLTPSDQQGLDNYNAMQKMRKFVGVYEFTHGKPITELYKKLEDLINNNTWLAESKDGKIRELLQDTKRVLGRNIGRPLEKYEYYTEAEKKLFLGLYEKVMG